MKVRALERKDGRLSASNLSRAALARDWVCVTTEAEFGSASALPTSLSVSPEVFTRGLLDRRGQSEYVCGTMIQSSATPIIRRAAVSDAEPLSALARRTFSDAFAADNTPEDLAKFLDATYSPELQRNELQNPVLTCLVVERDGAFVAYALLRQGKTSPHVSDPTAIELQRFYVDQAAHGTGLAQQLMAACVAQATELGAATLFLGVWEHNQKALRFYRKHGFETVGNQIFRVGTDDQTDFVMARSVAPMG